MRSFRSLIDVETPGSPVLLVTHCEIHSDHVSLTLVYRQILWYHRLEICFTEVPEETMCDLSGSWRKLQVKIYDTNRPHVENISPIFGIIGSDDKPKTGIYDPSGSHSTQPMKTGIRAFSCQQMVYNCEFWCVITQDLWNNFLQLATNIFGKMMCRRKASEDHHMSLLNISTKIWSIHMIPMNLSNRMKEMDSVWVIDLILVIKR